jgi:hypothetical protein
MARRKHSQNDLTKVTPNLFYHHGFKKFYNYFPEGLGEYYAVKHDKRLRKKYANVI